MKDNKYGDIDALMIKTEDSADKNKPERARKKRPLPAIAAMNGVEHVSATDLLRTEKETIEKELTDVKDKFEKEKATLLDDLQTARKSGNAAAPIVLTMPVTKQEVTFELKRIDPSLIDVSDENERIQEFLDEISLNDILPSLKKHGQQKPGTVRPTEGGRFELIEGSRRLASVKLAGLEYLALVGKVPDADVRELSVIENKHQDVSPYEKAKAYKRMIDAGEFANWSQLSAAKGISTSHMSRFKSCAELGKVFVQILPSPSDMPLSYGETISSLLKKGEKVLTEKAKNILALREQSLGNDAEALDVDEILKELKSAVRTKTETPKMWKPVLYESNDGHRKLKHAMTNKGATKIELVGLDKSDIEKVLQYLTKTLHMEKK